MPRLLDSLLRVWPRPDRIDELDDRLLADIGLPRRDHHLKAHAHFLGALRSRVG